MPLFYQHPTVPAVVWAPLSLLSAPFKGELPDGVLEKRQRFVRQELPCIGTLAVL